MRLGRPIVHLASTTSTMDEVARRAQEGASEGLVVCADLQTAGRGRAGRAWAAAPGSSLLCSVLLRPSLPADRLTAFPLIVGVAVAEAIDDIAAVSCSLKWPNDVLIDHLKVGGILMTAGQSIAGSTVIVGIGVNLTQRSDELPAGATSIAAATGIRVDRDALLTTVLDRLDDEYRNYVAANGAAELGRWRARAGFLGDVVVVSDGDTRFTGRFVDVDETGALLIDDGLARRRIVAGDLSRGPRRR